MTDARDHWQTVYRTKDVKGVSWYRRRLDISLELLKQAGLNRASRVIDVGAGASTLVDDLLDLGVRKVIALDISEESLLIAKNRLGPRAAQVEWIVGNAATQSLPEACVDIWHDRAALHFLTDPNDQRAYVANATGAVAKQGHVVIGCFASDGPENCSGLPVVRRDPEEIAQLFGSAFTLIDSRRDTHVTPGGASQSFAYVLLQRR